jgi:HEAT repeats/WD domain, G-beta repeat
VKKLLCWLIDVAVGAAVVVLGVTGVMIVWNAAEKVRIVEQRMRGTVDGVACLVLASGILVLRVFVSRKPDAEPVGSLGQSAGGSHRRRRMLRLCCLLCSGVVVLVASLCLVNPFQVTDVAIGLVRGEKFFKGRPAHWWLDELDSHGLREEDARAVLTEGGPDALPVLAEVANNHDVNARSARLNAIRVLGGMKTAEAVPILRKLLADEDARIREDTTSALGELGPLAAAAVPDLYAILNRSTSDRDDRHDCRSALNKIAVKSAVQGVFWQQTDPGLEWTALTFSADGQELMGIRQPNPFIGEIHRWSVTGDPWNVVPLPDWVRTDAALSPDGRLAAVYGRGDLQLWDLTTRQVRTLEDNAGPLREVSAGRGPFLTFSRDGRTLAVADGRNLRLFDVGTGHRIHREKDHFQGLAGSIPGVAFSPDNKTLLVVTVKGDASELDALWLFDISTGQLLRRLLDAEPHQTITTFSPDGNLLATVADYGRQVNVWDVKSGRQVALLDPQVGGIAAVAFGPDSLTLAIGAWDRHLSIWDAQKGQKLHDLDWHHHAVSAVAFSPDGRTLASADSEGWVKLWDLSGDRLR